jgi:hypothetical protein
VETYRGVEGSSTHSQRRHLVEVSDLVYIPIVLASGKKRAVTIGYEVAGWAPQPV